MRISQKITELRRTTKLTRRQLAEESGISMSHLNRLELGEITAPHLGTLQSIAIALDITLEELIEGVNFIRD